MAFGKLSFLIGSFAAAVFNGGNNPSDHSNALFFIGNGAYYSSNPEESVTNPRRGTLIPTAITLSATLYRMAY